MKLKRYQDLEGFISKEIRVNINDYKNIDYTNRRSTRTFKKMAKEKHNDEYDYSKVNYINNRENVKIICKEHSVFEQSPGAHLQGSGCPQCARYKRVESYKRTIAKKRELA